MKVKQLIAILEKMPADADVQLKVWEESEEFDEDQYEYFTQRSWWPSTLDHEQVSCVEVRFEDFVVYFG